LRFEVGSSKKPDDKLRETMAVMIPDRMPSGASAGEKELFSVLQRLPDDCLVYYEPIIENRYPDFVVVCPSLGIMTIEVKGWDLNKLVAADSQEVKVLDRGVASIQKHPTRQARDYKFKLMNFCRESRFASCLLRGEGAHQGRFGFPFGHFVLLSNITCKEYVPQGFYRIFRGSAICGRCIEGRTDNANPRGGARVG
jgi:hypothetical protein